MSHCDPEDLALLALGEECEAAAAHVSTCAACARERDELARIVGLARSPRVELVPPPHSVWEGIVAETGAAPPPGLRLITGGSAPSAAPSGDSPVRTGARTNPLRNSWFGLLAAACVGALVGGGVVAWRSPDAPEAGPTQVVASATLQPLVPAARAASVNVIDDAGQTRITVDASGLPKSADGFYEVWLLDADAKKLIALGTLDASEKGSFTIPVSLREFPIVDISIEPKDGDPAHSTKSVLRGSI